MSIKPKKYIPRSRSAPGRKYDGRKAITDLYNSDWEKYRKRYLEENPRCYACGGKATEVDHVVPHKGDKALFEKLDNHIPLCESHHSIVTGKFDRWHGLKSGQELTNKKILFLNGLRSQNNLSFRVKVLPYYK